MKHPKNRSHIWLTIPLSLSFGILACSGEAPIAGSESPTPGSESPNAGSEAGRDGPSVGETAQEPIDTNPQTLDEATDSLTQVSHRLEADPADPVALQALDELRLVLDRLNHLVARVEPVPGHVVSFYEPSPGMIGIAELGPQQEQRVLNESDALGTSPVELYRRLAGTEPPAELVDATDRQLQGQFSEAADNGNVDPASAGSSPDEAPVPELDEGQVAPSGFGTAQEALTAADGPWWAANACFTQGNFRGCFPNWGGGGYAQANTKTSFFEVAPFSGDFLQVRFKYQDSTKFTDAAFPGQWLTWWWHSSLEAWPCGFLIACGYQDYNIKKHRWDILQASNDGFHWSHSFKWSCGNTGSCDSWPW